MNSSSFTAGNSAHPLIVPMRILMFFVHLETLHRLRGEITHLIWGSTTFRSSCGNVLIFLQLQPERQVRCNTPHRHFRRTPPPALALGARNPVAKSQHANAPVLLQELTERNEDTGRTSGGGHETYLTDHDSLDTRGKFAKRWGDEQRESGGQSGCPILGAFRGEIAPTKCCRSSSWSSIVSGHG